MLSEPETATAAPLAQALPPAETEQGAAEAMTLLLLEVKALAVRIRQLERFTPDWAGVPSGGQQVLRLLVQHGTQTVPQLAQRRGTSRQNIRIMVNQLLRKGYVEIVPHPGDKRCGLIQVTEQGRGLVQAGGAEGEALAVKVAGQLDEAEARSAAGVLRLLRQRLVELQSCQSPMRSSKTKAGRHKPRELAPDFQPLPASPAADDTPASADLPISLL